MSEQAKMPELGSWLLVGVYLAAIVTANIITARYGPSASYVNAFALIGLDFVTRDRLADFWGTRRRARMAALIAAGALLSWFVNRDAAQVALASGVAFAAAESVEAVLYHALRRRPWVTRAAAGAILPAAIDSLIFPTIAFGGVMWTVTGWQFAAKLGGVLFWALVVRVTIGAPRVAPEAT